LDRRCQFDPSSGITLGNPNQTRHGHCPLIIINATGHFALAATPNPR